MSGQTSPGTGRRSPLTLVGQVWRVARSSAYAPPASSDPELVGRIRQVLAPTPFHGEGYRKVWARLRSGAVLVIVGRQRVLRLLRHH